jgi:plasmid stabilization system protein ParE
VARVELSEVAVEDLERLVVTHSLPVDTKGRLRRSVSALGRFPLLGAELGGRWTGMRFVLGPWRWLVVVYVVIADDDRVVVVTIQDGRSSHPASGRR